MATTMWTIRMNDSHEDNIFDNNMSERSDVNETKG